MQRFLLTAALAAVPLCAQGPVAYLVDSNLDQLYTVDLATGNTTLIASTNNNGLGTPAGLAWREDTAELWTIDLAGGEVGTIDVTNGTFTPVFQTNLSGWQAIAWDDFTRTFHLANQNGQNYVLDPATGTTTLLGASGASLITCSDVDAAGDLFGINFFTPPDVLSLNKTTGAGSSISQTITGFQGFAIDPDGIWYGVNTNDDSLYRIDPSTGTATLIGPNPGIQFAKGFEIAGSGVMRGGKACQDGNNDARRMEFSGTPNIGGTLNLGIELGSTQFPASLLFGFSPDMIGAFTLPLDLGPLGAPGCSIYTSSDFAVGPIVTGTQIPVSVPATPALVGGIVLVQGVIIDGSGSANALGVAVTDFLRIVVTQ